MGDTSGGPGSPSPSSFDTVILTICIFSIYRSLGSPG
ncbi:hypothetical protein CsSME_00031522 [Camellia sinensis var. sinensis]